MNMSDKPAPASIECQSEIDKDLVRTYYGDLDAFYRVRAALAATPALEHLGNAVYFCADIHPDDRNEALDNALAYYNEQMPRCIVEPSGHGYQRLVNPPLAATPAAGGEMRVWDSELGISYMKELKSTPEMRRRTRELAHPNRDDFDRAVIAALDDLDTVLAALALPTPPASPLRGIPENLTGELACILEDCDPPDNQTPEAVAALIRDYQPTWNRIRVALSASPPEQPAAVQDTYFTEDRFLGRCQHCLDNAYFSDKAQICERDPECLIRREREARAATLPEQPAADPPSCSHPKAKVWFYRDDDTYMRCEDCGSRWCESPTDPFQPHENCNCLMCLAEKSR